MGFGLQKMLQRIGRVVARGLRAFRWCRHVMRIEPATAIETLGPGHYRATCVGACLQLTSPSGQLPSGRAMITLHGARQDGPGRGERTQGLSPVLHARIDAALPHLPIRIPSTATEVPFTCLLPEATALFLEPLYEPGDFTLDGLTITEIGRGLFLLLWLGRLLKRAGREPGWLLRSIGPGLRLYRSNGWLGLRSWLRREMEPVDSYTEWVRFFDTLGEEDRTAIRQDIDRLAWRPQISVLLPVYNTPERWLRRAIASVQAQLYPDWELCIANDASSDPQIASILETYAAADPRIRVTHRTVNGHIAAASNSALALARGSFIALLDHDDELHEAALYHIARELNLCPEADLLFSDEDKIDPLGQRSGPCFKPDWNPDLMRSLNAVSHLGVYRRALVNAVGGFRTGYEGAQDYDLALRIAEQTSPARIRHIPRILYHWRVFPGSTALSGAEKNYAWDAGRRAIADHLARCGVIAEVTTAADGRYYRVCYPLPDPPPRVSLLVPTRDRVALLRGCIEGLRHQTDYPDLEILILDNGSREPDTLAYFAEAGQDPRVRVLHLDGPFNYSALNNAGAHAATGHVIGLINNDIQVIHRDWLQEMVAQALRPDIGAVGALLYYGNETVQHGGVVMGMGGLADHLHRFLPRDDPGYFARCAVVQNLSAVTAACLLVRRELFFEVGCLDAEHLKVAFNDVDFCLRLGQRGYRNLWTPFARLYHLESASRGSDDTPLRRPEFLKEMAWMHARWSGIIACDPCFNPNLALSASIPAPAFPPRVPTPWRTSAAISSSRSDVLPAPFQPVEPTRS